jgi:hypothetical protein
MLTQCYRRRRSIRTRGSAHMSSRILVRTACRPKARDAQVLLLVKERAAEARCPLDARQRAPVGSRVLPHPPVVPSNGRALEVKRRGPTAIGDGRRLPQDPSRPSRPTCGPPRRLLVLLPQQQLDALSDERRGVPVPRVRDKLPHKVPRRLIHAEGDHSRLSCHSLSWFPWAVIDLYRVIDG